MDTPATRGSLRTRSCAIWGHILDHVLQEPRTRSLPAMGIKALVHLHGHEAFVAEAVRRLRAGEDPEAIRRSFEGFAPRSDEPLKVAQLLLWQESRRGLTAFPRRRD